MTEKKSQIKKEKTKVNNAIAKASEAAVAVINSAPRGFENEDAKDLLLPRVELLQGLSPAVQEGKGKAGDIVNQISKSPLSSDEFLPITMQRRYIKWIPRDQGGGVEYQTSDPNDPRVLEDTKWGDHGEKPTCTAYMNFLVLMSGSTLPIILSFSMTNYQEGRKLYTMCKMAGCDMWLKKYKLKSKAKQNNMGTWHVFDIAEAGDSSAEEAQIAETLYHSFAKKQFNVDLDGGSDKPTAQASANEDF
jgi:hypothetical protein